VTARWVPHRAFLPACLPADAFAYIARYDRVYLRGLTATGIQIVANQPVTPGGGDYLSDHFGLLCTATLA
jgi:hypothetical protein